MSQNAIEGFLSEVELSEQIHRYFDLKVDKENISRPSKDLVVEIYTRFLDAIEIDWKRTRNHQCEPTLRGKMLEALKWIFKPYRLAFEINMSDLCMPTKKRTITFLNVALYVMAEFDALKMMYQEFQSQHAEQQQEMDKVRREIAERRMAVEQLALKLGQSKGVEQLTEDIEQLKRMFDEKEDESNKLKDKAAKVKAYNANKTDRIQALKDKLLELNQRIDQSAQIEVLKMKETQLKEKLATVERNREEFKRQADIKTTHCRSNIQRMENEMKDFIQMSRTRIESFKEDIATTQNRRTELGAKRKEKTDKIEESVQKANKTLQLLINGSNSLMAEADAGRTILANHKVKLDLLMRGDNKSMLNETVKNSTFIKSRAPMIN